LREDFFLVEGPDPGNSQSSHSIRKAKLKAQLAEAYREWHSTKDQDERNLDDNEGWNQRRRAVQLSLGAFLEWAFAEGDIPFEHTELLVGLASDLGDLNAGMRPALMKPSPRPRAGNPGIETKDLAIFATACAVIDVLARGESRAPIGQIEERVARAIGMPVGAFKSRRKAFKSGKAGPQARAAYDEMRQIFSQADPQLALKLLEKKIWTRK
jgi:hypothetical protein